MRRVLILAFLLSTSPAFSTTFNLPWTTHDKVAIFGGDAVTGDMVFFQGSSGILPMPLGVNSGATEIVVGQLSIVTHLTRDLPHGFLFFDFPMEVDVAGEHKTLLQQLMLTVDNSNDGATLLGGAGTTPWILGNGMQVDFQFLTAGTGAANDGETRSVQVIGQFYGSPVPEPSTFLLLGTGLAGLIWYRRRRA